MGCRNFVSGTAARYGPAAHTLARPGYGLRHTPGLFLRALKAGNWAMREPGNLTVARMLHRQIACCRNDRKVGLSLKFVTYA